MGLAIVAIPEENDRVWKVSSEKVPHLTLLFLGEAESADLQTIMQFVEHAVTMSEHGPFYLDIDHRDTLGEDEADVVFFNKRSWNLKWIKQFRGQLLKNDAIRTAYDSTEQFDEWRPHLTLGYPETPAKKDPEDEPFGHPLYSVCFDRIAVWEGNYEGPDFRLEWPDRELEGDLAIAYSDTQKAALIHYGEEAAEHSGVKGMKWGKTTVKTAANVAPFVSRRARNTEIAVDLGSRAVSKLKDRKTNRAAKKLHKQDVGWERKVFTNNEGIKRHNAMADHVNSALPKFNSDKRWKDQDGKDINLYQNKAKEKEYFDAYNKEVMAPAFHKAVAEVHGSSPSGLREASVEVHGDTMQIVIKDKAEHAATNVAVEFNIVRDGNGYVTEVTPKMMVQSAGEAFTEGLIHGVPELGEAFILEHYGIKGMRWGFRRSSPEAVAPTATSKVPHGTKRKTKIETDGGENHPAHEDAIKVAESRVKLKKSGPKALSNQELREVANRLQLENQVTLLNSSKGKQFVKRKLQNEGQELAWKGAKRGGKKVAKKAAVAALL